MQQNLIGGRCLPNPPWLWAWPQLWRRNEITSDERVRNRAILGAFQLMLTMLQKHVIVLRALLRRPSSCFTAPIIDAWLGEWRRTVASLLEQVTPPPPDVTFSQTSPDRLAREALSLTAEWSIDKQSFSARCGWVLLTSNCIGLGLSTKRANFKAFSDTKVLFLWTRYLAAFARHLLRVFLAFFFIRYALKRWERAASLVHVLYRARLLIVRRFALLRQHQRCSFRHKCVCVSRTCTARQSGNDQLIPVETSDARSIRNWRQFYDWADSRFCLWSLNDVNEVVWWMECWVLCLGWKHVRCGRSLLFCLRLPCNTNCTNFKVRFCLRKVLNQWFSSWGLRPQTPPWGSFAFLLVIESF